VTEKKRFAAVLPEPVCHALLLNDDLLVPML